MPYDFILCLSQNAISLPAGLQVPPNMFLLRNDQGQVMLMTGQPQTAAGGGGEVRLQQSAGTAVFRVCRCGACVNILNDNQIIGSVMFVLYEDCFENSVPEL